MRVLLVEDEAAMAATIAGGLTSEGYAVDVANDGLDGLWRAREHRYGAIVLDLLLPGMNGFEVCRTLRVEDNWTPILVRTAKQGGTATMSRDETQAWGAAVARRRARARAAGSFHMSRPVVTLAGMTTTRMKRRPSVESPTGV